MRYLFGCKWDSIAVTKVFARDVSARDRSQLISTPVPRMLQENSVLPKKTPSNSRTIERTTGMLGVRSAAESIRFRIRRSPTPAFQPAPGQCNGPFLKNTLPAGTGNLKRSFTRPQRRFRHHCGVEVPDLPFYFPARRLHRLVRSRTPCPKPVICLISRHSHNSHRHPLPFGSLEPSGSKRSTVPFMRSSPLLNARLSFAPRRILFRVMLRIDAGNPVCPAWLSFRKPWN